jgi:hypothetical protein
LKVLKLNITVSSLDSGCSKIDVFKILLIKKAVEKSEDGSVDAGTAADTTADIVDEGSANLRKFADYLQRHADASQVMVQGNDRSHGYYTERGKLVAYRLALVEFYKLFPAMDRREQRRDFANKSTMVYVRSQNE